MLEDRAKFKGCYFFFAQQIVLIAIFISSVVVLCGIRWLNRSWKEAESAIPLNKEERVSVNFKIGENFARMKKMGFRVWIVKIISTIFLVGLCIVDFIHPELNLNGVLSSSLEQVEKAENADQTEFSWLLLVMVILRILDLTSIYYLKKAANDKQGIRLVEASLMI